MDDVTLDEQGRPEPPLAGDELATLVGFLDFQRATFRWKTHGLDAAGLAATVGASTMTLGGLLKHLTLVEDDWLGRVLLGRREREPWASVDWSEDPDWEWRTAADDDPATLRAQWAEAVDRAREAVREAAADGGAGRAAGRPDDHGQRPSLRWILCHMIEEYARHNGHADLIRESVDGLVGE